MRARVILRGEWSGGGGGGGGGGGRQLVPEGGISYEWGGGGAAAPPEPMLDPGLMVYNYLAEPFRRFHVGLMWNNH